MSVPARLARTRGRVVVEEFESALLRGNRAGDPHVRRVPVYLPPSYDTDTTRRYPTVFALTGFMGRGRVLLNDSPWSPSLDDRMDALIASGACGEAILVMPDCFTRYGGSQYLDSGATGPYMSHIVQELVPHVDATYRTLAHRRHRGVMGKSSGGYGAFVMGMLQADTFGAIASHSGDVYFEYAYRGDVPKFYEAIERAGGVRHWLEAFEAKVQKKHDDFTVLNILGMAACYSPNPATPPYGIDVPCDLETGAFRDDVWARWLEHDPLVMLPQHTAALRSLVFFYMDCGVRDEWHLHLGARMLSRRLLDFEIPHEYHEFDDGHMNVTYRYEVSLPKMVAALSAKPSA